MICFFTKVVPPFAARNELVQETLPGAYRRLAPKRARGQSLRRLLRSPHRQVPLPSGRFSPFRRAEKSQPEQVVLLAIGRVTDLHEITLAKEAQPEKIGRVRQGGLVVPLHFYRCQEVAGLMAMAESSRYHG